MAELKLTHTVPIVAYQGLTVKVSQDGSVDLLFHQETSVETDNKAKQTVYSNVVAAVHIPDEERWEQIKKLVDEQLNLAKNREP